MDLALLLAWVLAIQALPPPGGPYPRTAHGVAAAIDHALPAMQSCLGKLQAPPGRRLTLTFQIDQGGQIASPVVAREGERAPEERDGLGACLMRSMEQVRFEPGPIELPVIIPVRVAEQRG